MASYVTLRLDSATVVVRFLIEGLVGTLSQPKPPEGPMGVPSVPTYLSGSFNSKVRVSE